MKRRMTRMVAALVVVFGGLAFFNFYRAHMMSEFFKNFKQPPTSVSTATAEALDWQPTLHAVGNIKSVEGVSVNSQQSGQIVGITFNSGDFVTKGTVLVKLDTSSDEASLAEDTASLVLAKINYERQLALYKKAASPKSEVDTTFSEMEQAQAATQKTQITVDQKSIKAPFTGLIGIRKVNLGEYVTKGSTVLASLESLDPLYLQFYIPEQYFPYFKREDTVYFQVDAYPDRYFLGKVDAIDSKVDSESHNILLQVKFANCPVSALDNSNHSQLSTVAQEQLLGINAIACNTAANTKASVREFALRPGMFARLVLKLPLQKNVIVIPNTSITYSLYGNSVYIVKGKKEKSTGKTTYIAHQQLIKTGDRRGNRVVITEGVNAGDVIVNAGQLKLQNGAEVTINNEFHLDEAPDLNKLGE